MEIENHRNESSSEESGSNDDKLIDTLSHTLESTSALRSKGGDTSSGDDDDAGKLRDQLSKQETFKVDILRYLVVALLLVSAAAISAVTYVICENSQQDAYSSQYEGASSKVIQAFEHIFDEIGIVNTVGIAATNYGILMRSVRNDSDWPFLTVHNFQQTSTTARLLSGALYVAIVPTVI